MKLGLHIGYWGLWGGAEEQLTAVQAAEELPLAIAPFRITIYGRYDRRQAEFETFTTIIVDRITAVATRKGVTPGQIALAWTIAQGTTPIPGTRRIKYLEENAAAADITLTAADLKALDTATPVGAAAGDRYIQAGMAALNH